MGAFTGVIGAVAVEIQSHVGADLGPGPEEATLRKSSTIERLVLPTDTIANDEFDIKAIAFWIKYADFYEWPHIRTF